MSQKSVCPFKGVYESRQKENERKDRDGDEAKSNELQFSTVPKEKGWRTTGREGRRGIRRFRGRSIRSVLVVDSKPTRRVDYPRHLVWSFRTRYSQSDLTGVEGVGTTRPTTGMCPKLQGKRTGGTKGGQIPISVSQITLHRCNEEKPPEPYGEFRTGTQRRKPPCPYLPRKSLNIVCP